MAEGLMPRERHPVTLFASVLLVVSFFELAIMLAFQWLGLSFPLLTEALLDSLLLALLAAPVLYFLMVRPLSLSEEELGEAEEGLRESEEKYRTVVESAREGISILRVNPLSVEFANPAMEKITGREVEELLGMSGESIEELIHPEDREKLLERMEDVLDEGEEFAGLQVRCVDCGGRLNWLSTSLAPINFEGKPGVLALFGDSTELKEREEQLRVLDRILRHNLHNEINLILGYAENILGEGESEDASNIYNTATRLIETTDKEKEIVDIVSKDTETVTIDLEEVAEGVVDELRSVYPEVEIELTSTLDGRGAVEALPELERAIEELVKNAVEHNDSESPNVELVLKRDGEAELTVIDNGPRIPDAEVRVLTESFQVSPMYHGSGMGLWLVNWIVRKSGGELRFRENEPRGNVVEVLLAPKDEVGAEEGSVDPGN